MKPYLMTIVILLILVHKTSGSMKTLPKQQKTEDFGSTCEGGEGLCRRKCRANEAEIHYCANGKKCCVKSYATILSNVVENNIDWSKFWITTSQPTY
ncbi:beta-defensin 29-like [Camelus dromedarius]|uniref:beta-defensin 29-like n=1 Tax=Camelus dromedarius TaxID=9838 RepID=UPI00311914AB